MMAGGWLIFLKVLAATVLVLAITASSVLAQSPAEARVLDLTCKGEVRRNGESKPLQLTSDDKGFPLQAGDTVRCSSAGYIVVQTADGNKPLRFNEPPILIEVVPEEPRYRYIAEELQKIGTSGGPRGTHSILWPTANAAVRPEEFVVLWKPLSPPITVTIASEDSQQLVWGPARISGTSGKLKSPNAQTALERYRKEEKGLLVLTLSRERFGDTDQVRFSVFSQKDEDNLQTMVKDWDKEASDLAKHLGRGYVFLRFGRFREAAAEYEVALATAPNSPYLLVDARDAEARAGNMSAVTLLDQRVRAIMKQRQGNAANE